MGPPRKQSRNTGDGSKGNCANGAGEQQKKTVAAPLCAAVQEDDHTSGILGQYTVAVMSLVSPGCSPSGNALSVGYRLFRRNCSDTSGVDADGIAMFIQPNNEKPGFKSGILIHTRRLGGHLPLAGGPFGIWKPAIIIGEITQHFIGAFCRVVVLQQVDGAKKQEDNQAQGEHHDADKFALKPPNHCAASLFARR